MLLRRHSIIEALLAVGAPLSAVTAVWLASPLMYPTMFLIISGTIGWDFAIAKTVSVAGSGGLGSNLTIAFTKSAIFSDPLRENHWSATVVM